MTCRNRAPGRLTPSLQRPRSDRPRRPSPQPARRFQAPPGRRFRSSVPWRRRWCPPTSDGPMSFRSPPRRRPSRPAHPPQSRRTRHRGLPPCPQSLMPRSAKGRSRCPPRCRSRARSPTAHMRQRAGMAPCRWTRVRSRSRKGAGSRASLPQPRVTLLRPRTYCPLQWHHVVPAGPPLAAHRRHRAGTSSSEARRPPAGTAQRHCIPRSCCLPVRRHGSSHPTLWCG